MAKTLLKTIGWLVAIALVLAVVAGVGWSLVGKRFSPNPQGQALEVRLEPVHTGQLVEHVSAPGQIEPLLQVDISARVSARITAVPFQAGQTVKQGDILVQLDDADLAANLKSAQSRKQGLKAQLAVEDAQIAARQASLLGTQATLAEAEKQLARQQALVQSGDASQQAFDQAKRTVDELKARLASEQQTLQATTLGLQVAKANIDAADADIQRVEDSLAYTTIRSPIDGVVTRVNVEVGEIALTGTMNNPGTVLLSVADLSKMTAVAQVDEADVQRVQAGQPVTVRIAAYPGQTFAGTVQHVALAVADGNNLQQSLTNNRWFETKVVLTDTPPSIRSGLSADVQIEVQTHDNVLLVPNQAVLGRPIDQLPIDQQANQDLVDPTQSLATVVFINDNNQAKLLPVRIGASDNQHTIVTAGLTEGQAVIVGPFAALDQLTPNQPITAPGTPESGAQENKESKQSASDSAAE